MTEFYNFRYQTARKKHKCILCHKTINKGDKYFYEFGKSDGYIYETKLCESCKEIYDAFANRNRGDLEDGYTMDDITEEIYDCACCDCENNKKCNINRNDIATCANAKKKYIFEANHEYDVTDIK